jgi:hypothetical protein
MGILDVQQVLLLVSSAVGVFAKGFQFPQPETRRKDV